MNFPKICPWFFGSFAFLHALITKKSKAWAWEDEHFSVFAFKKDVVSRKLFNKSSRENWNVSFQIRITLKFVNQKLANNFSVVAFFCFPALFWAFPNEKLYRYLQKSNARRHKIPVYLGYKYLLHCWLRIANNVTQIDVLTQQGYKIRT